jgi:hypothetical protein
VLIYIISLNLQSVMNMIIDNQCTNIELVSPVYFAKDTRCHIQFPQQVETKRTMKANFMTRVDLDAFGGVLLYHLQRKEDASRIAQLLIIWGCEYNKFYSHTWLTKDESSLIWNEEKLASFYHAYDSEYEAYSDIRWEKWLLDDNTSLKTECKISYGDFETKVTISEDKYISRPIKPLWIDPNR